MQITVTQEECNYRVKKQLVKMKKAQEDFCDITARVMYSQKELLFLVETYYTKDNQLFPKAYDIDSNYYFSLLQKSFIDDGLPVKECFFRITSDKTFDTYLTVVKSYAYQKKR